jgi:hypothetical protein
VTPLEWLIFTVLLSSIYHFIHNIVDMSWSFKHEYFLKSINGYIACMYVNASTLERRSSAKKPLHGKLHYSHTELKVWPLLILWREQFRTDRATIKIKLVKFKFCCSNTGSIRDDPHWTSRKNSSELIELSSVSNVSSSSLGFLL